MGFRTIKLLLGIGTKKDVTGILPQDLWFYIFSFMKRQDIGYLSLLSKRWKKMLQSPHFWKKLYETDFNNGVVMPFLTFNGLWKEEFYIRARQSFLHYISRLFINVEGLIVKDHTEGSHYDDPVKIRKGKKRLLEQYTSLHAHPLSRPFFENGGQLKIDFANFNSESSQEEIWIHYGLNHKQMWDAMWSGLIIQTRSILRTKSSDCLTQYSSKLEMKKECGYSAEDLMYVDDAIKKLVAFFQDNADKMTALRLNMILCLEETARKGKETDWPIRIGIQDPIGYLERKIEEGEKRRMAATPE